MRVVDVMTTEVVVAQAEPEGDYYRRQMRRVEHAIIQFDSTNGGEIGKCLLTIRTVAEECLRRPRGNGAAVDRLELELAKLRADLIDYGILQRDHRAAKEKLRLLWRDMGPVEGLDHDARTEAWVYWESETNITLIADTGNGAAMTIVDFYSGTDELEQVADGERDPGTLQIEVIGCSGPVVNQWDYDEPAEAVDVECERDEVDPSKLHVTVYGHFRSWTSGARSTAVSSFTLQL